MNSEADSIELVLFNLQDPRTIRLQSHRILNLAKRDKLKHFQLHEHEMQSTAAYVLDVINDQYPKFDIPYHSRWRHFEVGGIDRIKKMHKKLAHISSFEYGKILYELVILSVFLDAGAGPDWTYTEEDTGLKFSRSEGLALASLALYQKGILSADATNPYRIDADKLIHFTEDDLQHAFQITRDNPLEGVAGRVALLNQLGRVVKENTAFFGHEGRLGDLFTYVNANGADQLSALFLFKTVLNAFNSIWPKRISFHGVSLGDVWEHKALKSRIRGSEYIPFHKLSQWLTYSLIEPLEHHGIKVLDVNELTGLPEYRNGGLLIDTGLLTVIDPNVLLKPQDPSSELIVEWRALTVALLDELADLIRSKLHRDATSLPLAKILQGGTWEAGRRIASHKRPLGVPPIQIISDGTVF